jgi:hypothetical protein
MTHGRQVKRRRWWRRRIEERGGEKSFIFIFYMFVDKLSVSM